jgi:hypothetical protein
MDKAQVIQSFWSGFGLEAYDENSVPDDVTMPYISYSVATDDIDYVVLLSASVWYRSTSWSDVESKVKEISEAITKMNPPSIKTDNGRVYITKGSPFAQRMNDPSDDMVKRMYININVEFLTNY